MSEDKGNKPSLILRSLIFIRDMAEAAVQSLTQFDQAQDASPPEKTVKEPGPAKVLYYQVPEGEEFSIDALPSEIIQALAEEGVFLDGGELEEGLAAAVVDDQLGDYLAGTGKSVSSDPSKLVANELLLESRSFVLITISDHGEIKYQLEMERASDSDVAGFQVTCGKIAESLYDSMSQEAVDGEDEDFTD